MFSREKKTPIAEWWWTVDRELLVALLLLMVCGIVLSFAASPSVAERLHLPWYFFIMRQCGFAIPSIGVMVGASLLTARNVRIAALVTLVFSILALWATLKYGAEVKGARRWISFAGQSVQPSEFVKPAFAIIGAWLFSESMAKKGMPGRIITTLLVLPIVGALVLQPDVGQTALVLATWAALLFLSGISWFLIFGLLGGAVGLGYGAYLLFPHVSKRIDSFLNPEGGGNTYQVDKALHSLLEGGWFGRGPGELIAKKFIPDAHADYVFSAAAGEFGLLFCLVLVGLICFIVVRALIAAQKQASLFNRLAASTIAIQFGLQSAINLCVNLNLIPPKGMTLPFVSYGGTSMIAIAFGMGLMLAMTRTRPEARMASGLPAYRSAVVAPPNERRPIVSTIVLMAGGTAGHLFPAMALAQELRRRGHAIHLMTDERVAGYGDNFPAQQTHIVPSATPSIRNPVKLVAAAARLGWGTAVAFGILGNIKPDAMVGFGGYPTVPPFLAGRLRGVPGILHDSNAIIGRANHFLARYANVLALSFDRTARTAGFERKIVVTGNPVRDRVRTAAEAPYPALTADSPVCLLVFGGSQGARAFAELVPPAVALLPEVLRVRLRLVQQCRADDLDRVAEAYRQAKVNVELAAFFPDLPERMASSHLIISRSGASTVAELCVIGRPAILIPLPGAIDADQKQNALVLDRAGGGWIAEQAGLTPQVLAARFEALLAAPETLGRAAAVAKSLGRPDAVALLADLAEKLAAGRMP